MKQPFDQAVERHGVTVLRVCRAVLGATADADDAWSETFLAALETWPELPPDTNIEAWLVRVAYRKAIDVTRVRARHAVPVAEVPESRTELGVPERDEDDLWRAVGALPEQQRFAIAYHFFGGLTHAQTAELIGSSEAAVRRAAADGMRNLRQTFAPEDSLKGGR
jgi:RNA polymerase sigma factor (sigma-70 family)